MRLYFTFNGDFSKYTKEDLCFGAIEFNTNGKHYIVDLVGEVTYDFSKDKIEGCFKGNVELLDPEIEMTDEELYQIIKNMDKTTFQYNILDDGEYPEYRLLEADLFVNNEMLVIEKFGKQTMKVYDLFDLLRKYPDWNVDVVVESQDSRQLLDIADIVADERNGNLIIVTKEVKA